jgi:hypothetical protein
MKVSCASCCGQILKIKMEEHLPKEESHFILGQM